MAGIKSDVLKKVLASNRDELNRYYHFFRHTRKQIDHERFITFFITLAERLLENLSEQPYERLEPMVIQFFKTSLELEAVGFLNSLKQEEQKAFFALIDKFSLLVLNETRLFLSESANAIFSIGAHGEKCLQDWVTLLLKLPVEQERENLKDLGFIAAWRCGLAMYREKALEKASSVSPGIFALLFNLPGDLTMENQKEVIRKMRKDPWTHPENFLKDSPLTFKPFVKLAGGFKGFGGKFLSPPELYLSDQSIVARDESKYFFLYADCFGTLLIPVRGIPGKTGGCNSGLIENGVLKDLNEKYKISEKYKVPVKSVVANESTICYSSPLSHYLFITGACGE